jgi:hypothetical protein
LYQRYEALVSNRGPGRPSLLEHPLHADFLALAFEVKALLVAIVELSLEDDGSASSAAYAIKLKILGQVVTRKCDRLANVQLRKVEQS